MDEENYVPHLNFSGLYNNLNELLPELPLPGNYKFASINGLIASEDNIYSSSKESLKQKIDILLNNNDNINNVQDRHIRNRLLGQSVVSALRSTSLDEFNPLISRLYPQNYLLNTRFIQLDDKPSSLLKEILFIDPGCFNDVPLSEKHVTALKEKSSASNVNIFDTFSPHDSTYSNDSIYNSCNRQNDAYIENLSERVKKRRRRPTYSDNNYSAASNHASNQEYQSAQEDENNVENHLDLLIAKKFKTSISKESKGIVTLDPNPNYERSNTANDAHFSHRNNSKSTHNQKFRKRIDSDSSPSQSPDEKGDENESGSPDEQIPDDSDDSNYDCDKDKFSDFGSKKKKKKSYMESVKRGKSKITAAEEAKQHAKHGAKKKGRPPKLNSRVDGTTIGHSTREIKKDTSVLGKNLVKSEQSSDSGDEEDDKAATVIKYKKRNKKSQQFKDTFTIEEIMDSPLFGKFDRLMEKVIEQSEEADIPSLFFHKNKDQNMDDDIDIPTDSLIVKYLHNSLATEAAKMKALNYSNVLNVEKMIKVFNVFIWNIKDGMKVLPLMQQGNENEDETKLWEELAWERVFRSADCCLTSLYVLTSSHISKKLFMEDVIEIIIQFTKYHLINTIYPEFDPVYKINKSKDFYVKSKRHKSHQVESKCTLTLYNKLNEIVNMLAELIEVQTFTDSSIILISSLGTQPFFVENISDLQLNALRLITSIFSKYDKHRQLILEDILSSLARLPLSKRNLRSYKINSEDSIQMVSALVLQLIHCIVDFPPLFHFKMSTDNQLVDANNEYKNLPDHDIMTLNSYGNATKTAHNFLAIFLKKCSVRSCEEDFRTLFDHFVDDLLTTVNKPEWPASELLLTILGGILVQNFSDRKVEIALRLASLEYLGKITSKLRKDSLTSQSDALVLKEILDQIRTANEDSLQYNELKKEPETLKLQRLLLNYLQENSVNDPFIRFARKFIIIQWYCDILLKANKAANTNKNSDATASTHDISINESAKVSNESRATSRKTGPTTIIETNNASGNESSSHSSSHSSDDESSGSSHTSHSSEDNDKTYDPKYINKSGERSRKKTRKKKSSGKIKTSKHGGVKLKKEEESNSSIKPEKGDTTTEATLTPPKNILKSSSSSTAKRKNSKKKKVPIDENSLEFMEYHKNFLVGFVYPSLKPPTYNSDSVGNVASSVFKKSNIQNSSHEKLANESDAVIKREEEKGENHGSLSASQVDVTAKERERCIDGAQSQAAYQATYVGMSGKCLSKDIKNIHLDTEQSTFIAKYLASKRLLCRSYDIYLGQIMKVVHESAIAIRTKAMKCLANIIEADPGILAQTNVQSTIHLRLMDQSPSVREAAVELIGKCILARSELIPRYFNMIAERILDTGVSVRKRVIRILRDICNDFPEYQNITSICCKLVRRIHDEEGIKKLVIEVFQAMWFNPEFTNETVEKKISNITETVNHFMEQGPELIETLLDSLLSNTEDPNYQNVYKAGTKIVHALIDKIMKIDENRTETSQLRSQKLVSCLSTLYLFTKIDPEFTVKHCDTLQPYLAQKCNIQDDHMIIHYVAKIFRLTVPKMGHPNPIFLSHLEESLMRLIVTQGMLVLEGCVACLADIVKQVTFNYGLVTDCFLRFFGILYKMALETYENENCPVLNSKKSLLLRSLYTVGLLCMHFDFDQEDMKLNKKIFQEKLLFWENQYYSNFKKVHMDKSNNVKSTDNSGHEFNSCNRKKIPFLNTCNLIPVSECVFEIFFHFVTQKDEIIKQKALSGLGFFCINYSRYLSHSKTKELYQLFLTDPAISVTLKCQVLKNIYSYLQEEENKTTMANKEWEKTKKEDDFKEINEISSSLSSAIVQIYLKDILDRSLDLETNVRCGSNNVLATIIKQGLVYPVQCVPYLIAMATDPNTLIKNKARKLMGDIDIKYPGFVSMKALAGSRKSFELQKICQLTYINPPPTSINSTISTEPSSSPNKKSQNKNANDSSKDTDNLTSNIVRGLVTANVSQTSANNSANLPSTVTNANTQPLSTLGFLYTLLRNSKAQRRFFIDSLLKLFDEQSKIPLEELLYIADNLAYFPYVNQEEPLFVLHQMEIMTSVTGSNILQAFSECFGRDTQSKNHYLNEDYEDDDDIDKLLAKVPDKPLALYECCVASQGYFLLLYLRQFLKNLYGLTDNKLANYSPMDTSKVFDKPIGGNRKYLPTFKPQSTVDYLSRASHQLYATMPDHTYTTQDKLNLIRQYLEFKEMMLKLDPNEEDDDDVKAIKACREAKAQQRTHLPKSHHKSTKDKNNEAGEISYTVQQISNPNETHAIPKVHIKLNKPQQQPHLPSHHHAVVASTSKPNIPNDYNKPIVNTNNLKTKVSPTKNNDSLTGQYQNQLMSSYQQYLKNSNQIQKRTSSTVANHPAIFPGQVAAPVNVDNLNNHYSNPPHSNNGTYLVANNIFDVQYPQPQPPKQSRPTNVHHANNYPNINQISHNVNNVASSSNPPRHNIANNNTTHSSHQMPFHPYDINNLISPNVTSANLSNKQIHHHHYDAGNNYNPSVINYNNNAPYINPNNLKYNQRQMEPDISIVNSFPPNASFHSHNQIQHISRNLNVSITKFNDIGAINNNNLNNNIVATSNTSGYSYNLYENFYGTGGGGNN
ncbi:unnamed protein product [Gordionus sp. m RMFG-2023]